MLKSVSKLLSNGSAPREDSNEDAQTGNRPPGPKSIITQVQRHPISAEETPRTPQSVEKQQKESVSDNESCLSRCCRWLFNRTEDDYLREEETAEELIYLGPQSHSNLGKKTLVLDLDETLVHSTFDDVKNPDLLLPLDIQGETYHIKVMVRPGVEEYLRRMGELYEVVVFTASLSEYANPLVDTLDKTGVVAYRLFREHCTLFNGVYVKDLGRLGRDLKDVIIVDNSPNSFIFHPMNALLIKNFFDDKEDRELDILTPFFEYMSGIFDVRPTEAWRVKFQQGQADEFLEVQKSKRHLGADNLGSKQNRFTDDDISPLHGHKKSGDMNDSQDAETDPSVKNTLTEMVKPTALADPNKRRSSYTKLPNGETVGKRKPEISRNNMGDIFSPKTENDEPPTKNKGNRSFIDPRKKNTANKVEVRSVTEHAMQDLDPVELEKVMQLEMSNEEDVEDPNKIDKRRFLNDNLINIQSPVHHKVGGFFKDPDVKKDKITLSNH